MPPEGADRPTDSEIVQRAAEAAENVIFSRCSKSAVRDVDVTVSFRDEVLEVDVYLDVSDETEDVEQITDDAALAARGAVDELLES